MKAILNHLHRTSKKTYNGFLILIAVVTLSFAFVKLPLEFEILSSAIHDGRRASINDFYNNFDTDEEGNPVPHSPTQNIDVEGSYHFFSRQRHGSLRKGHLHNLKMAKKVDEIIHRYLDKDHKAAASDPHNHEHRHLKFGAHWKEFSGKLKNVVERYLGRHDRFIERHDNNNNSDNKHPQQGEEATDNNGGGGIQHERKEEDPFDKEFSHEVQQIVDHYTEKEENDNNNNNNNNLVAAADAAVKKS